MLTVMQRTPWIERLLEGLSPPLEACGFVANRQKQWFTRDRGERWDRFDLQVRFREDHVWVSAGCGVRFNAVEDIFHRTSGFPKRAQSQTDTVGVDLWRLYGDDAEILIASAADVEPASEKAVELFVGYAQPYFEKFRTLQAVDLALNASPNQPCIHKVQPWLRCATGTIVGSLQQREDLGYLVQTYCTTLSVIDGGFYLSLYEALLRDLGMLR